jgi:hypothetical protein
MRVAGAFIRKNSDEILGFRALGFEADEQMTPMHDHQPSVEVSQCLLRRPLKLAIYPAAATAASVTHGSAFAFLGGLFDTSELVEVEEFWRAHPHCGKPPAAGKRPNKSRRAPSRTAEI